MAFKSRVIVDERERHSSVPDMLQSAGLQVDYRVLNVGDYVVSSDCAVERKSGQDFIKSLYSGRLFDQAQRLREQYRHPILIVEGDLPLIIDAKAKPRAFWGALTTLVLQFGINVFFTTDAKQTADLIYTLTQRRGLKQPRGPWIRKKTRTEDLEKTQLTLIASLPGIGPKLAERILIRFRTVRKVFSASIAELALVKGLGRVRAERIARVLDSPYGLSLRPSKHITLDTT
jgi:DNA excision repair protein ERCC-4